MAEKLPIPQRSRSVIYLRHHGSEHKINFTWDVDDIGKKVRKDTGLSQDDITVLAAIMYVRSKNNTHTNTSDGIKSKTISEMGQDILNLKQKSELHMSVSEPGLKSCDTTDPVCPSISNRAEFQTSNDSRTYTPETIDSEDSECLRPGIWNYELDNDTEAYQQTLYRNAKSATKDASSATSGEFVIKVDIGDIEDNTESVCISSKSRKLEEEHGVMKERSLQDNQRSKGKRSFNKIVKHLKGFRNKT